MPRAAERGGYQVTPRRRAARPPRLPELMLLSCNTENRHRFAGILT